MARSAFNFVYCQSEGLEGVKREGDCLEGELGFCLIEDAQHLSQSVGTSVE